MVCLQIYLAHDLFEGFTVDIVSSVIASFIREGLFDLDGFNEIILSFAYSESDKNRKPQLLKVKPLNSLKVKQIAYEMWTLIRPLSLMIDSLIPLGNNVWSIYIEFVQIVEILCGTELTSIALLLLQDKIDTFFPKYMDFFPNVIMKPKGQFLQHYPAMIKTFGPLIKTFRFESKNGYFKSTFQSKKSKRMFVTVWQEIINCSCAYIILNHLSLALKSPKRDCIPRKLH